MELYLEKEFLDNFYAGFDNKSIESIVLDLITNYGNKQVFINYNLNDFLELKDDNEFFALIGNTTSPIPIQSIKEHLFNKSNFKQTIVFTNKKEDWNEEAENRGALCFSLENYQIKIKKIIDNLHFKIDLSQNFLSWDFLENYKYINYNNLVITDGYILSDKYNQRIIRNIIPILKKLISNRNGKIDIAILIKDLNPIKPEEKYIKEKAIKRHRKLNSIFSKTKSKFSIIISDFKFNIKLHDRNIATNFSLLDCGEGFNLMPYKPSNSQIISETIFDKYTYNRLNNLQKNRSKYIEKLKTLETIKFKMYP